MAECAERLITGCRIACLRPEEEGFGLIEDASVIVRDGRIAWAGPRREQPEDVPSQVDDLGGRLLTPGLIDCHTHLVFAGNRAAEFEQRLKGATYEQIARAGGGIVSSVRQVRAASEDELIAQSLPRLRALMAEGVTTVEIKSGYGLDEASELKMLRAARALGAITGVRVRTSYLALHALPPEYRDARGAYVDRAVDEWLPRAHAEGLVDMVDAYLEPIAFDQDEVSRLFARARALGLPVRLHADQLSDGGGAGLAARHGALSADHVEYASEAGVRAMAEAGVVAVLLPGAYLALREETPPPVDLMRRHKVPMAVASDLNPGTSPLNSLLLAGALACAQFRLTPEEALKGMTCVAARALGLAGDVGEIRAGQRADLAVWDVSDPAELCYWLGRPLCAGSYIGGVPVATRS
ncbi:MAG: imidazolonepropionase [Brevundimonas sp.]|uniref:imidazolonepropionase n=1 Tax=Brevundimonas sp. TaxID=1871086 RepID=UPI00391C4FFC